MITGLAPNIILFIAAAVVIGITGVILTRDADRLADRTGVGEAMFGAVFLGVSTSLAGTVTSVTAALDNAPALAFSNAIGGIAAQTFFLAIADIFYRRANLEHAAASQTNLFHAGQLLLLLSLPLGAALLPETAVFWRIHPVTPLLLAIYLGGLALAKETQSAGMWLPKKTSETREDEPDAEEASELSTGFLAVRFLLFAILVSLAGYAIAKSGQAIAAQTGLSHTIVGFLFTAVATSLPELVTTVAAVRRGALTLAVGGIIGGNTFDVLFLVASDLAYRPGSLYHAVGQRELFLLVWSIAMTAILLMGLIKREEKGPGKIGFESLGLILFYIAGVVIQVRLG